MKVWSFLETVDSTMHVMDAQTKNIMEFNAPITSIRSGLLGIEHETEIPVATDHAGIATFHGQQSTRDEFLIELSAAVKVAVEISGRADTPLNVEEKVMVQINAFFEDTALGVSDESPLKLWSSKVSLKYFLSRGPSACLRERLGRGQPSGLDDSSISSFDSPRSSYAATGSGPQDHGKEPPEKKPKPLRHSLPYKQSFESTASASSRNPRIHITEADISNDPPSPPPPPEQRRKNSLTKALGLIPVRLSHRRGTSVSGSEASSEQPTS